MRFTRDDSFNTMLAGVASLLIFSRALGLGSLWRAFLGDDYAEEVADLAQEGTELLCYCLIFFSAACFYHARLSSPSRSTGSRERLEPFEDDR